MCSLIVFDITLLIFISNCILILYVNEMKKIKIFSITLQYYLTLVFNNRDNIITKFVKVEKWIKITD